MVNLCNGGSESFMELWEIIRLKIWTHFSIRQAKLFWINLKHYSQTCSNNYFCRMTTHLRQPIMSPLKQIPVQSLLCKTITCLMQLAITFLSPKWKKACLKQPIKNLIRQRNAKQTQIKCIKNKHLSDYTYSIATL